MEASDGTPSDHGVVYCSVQMQRVPSYTVEKFEYLRVDDEGIRLFSEWLETQDWGPVVQAATSTDKVRRLHELFEQAKASCFKKVVRSKESCEPPWMTDDLRKWICRRGAVFWREKKSQAWKRIHDKVKKWIEERKKGYVDEMKQKMLSGNAKTFYKCVRGITSNNNKTRWSPRSLYPGMN